MTNSPSTKPYIPVATGDDAGGPANPFRDNPYNDDGLDKSGLDGGGPGILAAQSLDLELEQDRNEMRAKERSIRFKLGVSSCLLLALAFGGREYYVRNYGDDSSVSAAADKFHLFGIRGSSSDGNSLDLDDDAQEFSDLELAQDAQEPFEGANDSEGGMVLELVEGKEDDYLGGVTEYEGDLDDEINNGKIGGEFDSDMDYDDNNNPEDEEFQDDAPEEGEFQGEGDFDDEINVDGITDDEYLGLHLDEDEEHVGEEAVSSGKTFETEEGEDNIIDANPSQDLTEFAEIIDTIISEEGEDVTEYESNNQEPDSENEYLNGDEINDLLGDKVPDEEDPEQELPDDESDIPMDDFAQEELTEEEPQEEELPEEEFSEEVLSEDDELPDYFVPLAPPEREELKEKLRNTLRQTKNALLQSESNFASPQRTLVLSADAPKQFMHMHHMKTGGTSMDGLIRCALSRQRDLHNGTRINYNSMSECGSTVKRCMDTLADKLNSSVVENVFYQNGVDGEAQVDTQFSFDPSDETLGLPVDDLNVCKTSEANVMSYCASLHTVRTFGWKGADKITVIRNPVDRAWSMYRFSLDRCYNCQEMKDVLRSVHNGTFTSRHTKEEDKDAGPNFVYSPNDSCAVQMIGHQATNLLSSVDLYNVASDVRFPREKEIIDEAVKNLREEFTWIGITDRIQESVDGIRTVFPFLADNLNEAALVFKDKYGEVEDGGFSLPEGYNDEKGCPFEHRNAGRDPRCGTKELDDETISLIKKLNNRDVAVYKAAVERFELQQEVLEEYEAGSL